MFVDKNIKSNFFRERGVYFLANDAVYDWAIAFLNSFREFNPDLRLILIPFNENCDRLFMLKEKYNFEIFIDPEFSRLETIGKAFELGHTPTGPYWFRRYAAYWGPLDRFMYLDARQIVLANLDPFIDALDKFGFDLLHYDCAINQVYEQGDFHRQLLKQWRGRGFLSGLWASRKGLFTIEEFEKLSTEALKIRAQLNPRNTDQAFFNYCCDMKPVCCGHFAEVMGNLCVNTWAGYKKQLYKKQDRYLCWDHGGLQHKKQLPLLHWAGIKLGPIMPHASIYLNFRLKGEGFLKAIIKRIWWVFLYPFFKAFDVMRRNHFLNNVYHRINKKTKPERCA